MPGRDIGIRVGDIIGGFRIDSVLGEGGFATVYAATELSSAAPVAIKVLRPEGGRYDRATRTRFEREVSALARLSSTYTVRIRGHGQSEAGLLYAAFERVPGRDLGEQLKVVGRMTSAQVLAILSQVLESLHEAHSAGLIHRDIKPQNIMLVSPEGPTVKLLDFGIARASDESHPSVTRTGELLGTPRYMSPEQLTGRPLGPPSDIYTLGLVGIELLGGREALEGNAVGEQLSRMLPTHRFEIPEVDDLGRHVATVLRRMTAHDPNDRFSSAAAVLAALNGPRMGLTWTDVPGAVPKRGLHIAVGLALLLALVLGLWVVKRDASTPVVKRTHVPPSALLKSTAKMEPPPTPSTPSTPEDAGVTEDLALPDLLPRRQAAADAVRSSGCGKPTLAADGQLAGTVIYLPSNYDADIPHPMIVALHSDLTQPTDLLHAGFVGLAEDEGVIILLPTYGETYNTWRNERKGAAVVRSAQEAAREGACVDESRIFVVMTGDGARPRRTIACEPWVRAIGINSFIPDVGDGHRCDRPIPAIWLLPQDAPGVPLDGSGTPIERRIKLTQVELERDWSTRNGCRGEPRKTANPVCRQWSCEVPFEVCSVPGDEGWVRTGPQTIIKGRPERFPRAREMWSFFAGMSGLEEMVKEAR